MTLDQSIALQRRADDFANAARAAGLDPQVIHDLCYELRAYEARMAAIKAAVRLID